MTVSAMVLGEAPGYCPLTTTVGGTISGYSLMGRLGMARRPATVSKIASTVAKIGRSMKNEEMFIALALGRGWLRCGRLRCGRLRRPRRSRRCIAAHDHPLWCDGDAWMNALRAVHDDDVSGFQAFAHDAQAIDHPAQGHLAILDLVVGTERKHVLLALICVDRPVPRSGWPSIRRCRAAARGQTAPGVKRPSLFCSTARARMVPVCGFN